jgi:hypothetical protein
VDSQGELLFEGPSGKALIDFRRTGGHGRNILVRGQAHYCEARIIDA